jgi:phosphatidylglycerol:prolipoprotein diacylglycerol transferase
VFTLTIGISPVLVHLGVLEIRWYGVMVALAVVAVIAISLREAKRRGVAQEHIYNLAVWAVLGGIIMSRLLHVIDEWQYYVAHPQQLISFAGLTIYGAVLGALIALAVYAWVKKLSIWQLADTVAPGAILGQAVGRIGCTINGCCYGLENPPWWAGAIVYTNPQHALLGTPVGVPLYPTQLYHLAWNLIGFAVLWSLRKRLAPLGSLFLLYLAIYAAGDLAIRSVRQGVPFLFGLQQAQLIGSAILLVTVPWLCVRIWLAKRKAAFQPPSDASPQGQNRGA